MSCFVHRFPLRRHYQYVSAFAASILLPPCAIYLVYPKAFRKYPFEVFDASDITLKTAHLSVFFPNDRVANPIESDSTNTLKGLMSVSDGFSGAGRVRN